MQRNGDTRMRATHSFSACLSTSFLALLWLQLPTSFAPPASTVLLLLLCLILQVFSPSSLQPERTSFCRFCLQEPGSCMTRLESKRERQVLQKRRERRGCCPASARFSAFVARVALLFLLLCIPHVLEARVQTFSTERTRETGKEGLPICFPSFIDTDIQHKRLNRNSREGILFKGRETPSPLQ